MSDAPYVNFYTSDFLGGTSGMTASTKGVYITLTCLMYEGETPLHQSWDMLARCCGATLPAFKKAVADLQSNGKMILKDGGLWSPKCDKHIALRSDRRNSAKAAAEIRWEKSKQKQLVPDATASVSQCQPEPEPEPYKKEEKEEAQAPPKSRLPADWALSDEGWQYARSQNIPDNIISDEAKGFHAYWTDRRDRDATKSARGWEQCWATRCRTIAPKYARGGMAGGPRPFSGGQGASLASIVAQRRIAGIV